MKLMVHPGAIAALCFAFVSPLQSQELRSSGTVGLNSRPSSCSGSTNGGTPLSVHCANTSTPLASGEAYSVASYGHLGVSAYAVASFNTNSGMPSQAAVQATAASSDYVTIDSPDGLSGTGLMTFSSQLTVSYLDSQLLLSLPAIGATVMYSDALTPSIAVNGIGLETETLRNARYLPLTRNSLPPGAVLPYTFFHDSRTFNRRYTYTVPVTFGVPFLLELGLVASSEVENTSTGWVERKVDASQSFAWAGIDDVQFGGQSVAYTLTSASGTDWTNSFVSVQAVPEPSTYASLLLGLGVFMTGRRYRPSRDTRRASSRF